MARLLVIDDDRELNQLLAEYLAREGFELDFRTDGPGGLEAARSDAYDAVLLDVMLPGMDGFAVLRELRRASAVPVLMLTARGDDTDTVVGLEIGADDYLSKPFNPRVLIARLRALLRRGIDAGGEGAQRVGQLAVGDVVLDDGTRRVSRGEVEVELTGAEFNVLYVLLYAAGQVVARDTISREALGRPLQAQDRAVDMHVSNLRRKLGPAPDGSSRIRTLRGSGYQYVRD